MIDVDDVPTNAGHSTRSRARAVALRSEQTDVGRPCPDAGRRQETRTGARAQPALTGRSRIGAAPRSNLEIARSITLRPIAEIAAALGILDDELQPFGRHIAKMDRRRAWERIKDCPNGRYIDVTGITPTPLGEGKTLVTIGLSMALNTIGKRAIGTIRQPSLGPVLGSRVARPVAATARCSRWSSWTSI